MDVGAAAGGKGGAGGDGGPVTVDNTGQILTLGPNSAGIYAQSVGGSGGVGGTVQPANNPQALTQLPDTVPLSGAIAIGGGGGNSGGGGTVTCHQRREYFHAGCDLAGYLRVQRRRGAAARVGARRPAGSRSS